MDIKTDNITALLREQIAKFDLSVDVSEVGEVLEVGDGVARVSGLENVMSSELVELQSAIWWRASCYWRELERMGLQILRQRPDGDRGARASDVQPGTL